MFCFAFRVVSRFVLCRIVMGVRACGCVWIYIWCGHCGTLSHEQRLQDKSSTFAGPIDVVRKVIAADGVLGLYAGMEATFWRYVFLSLLPPSLLHRFHVFSSSLAPHLLSCSLSLYPSYTHNPTLTLLSFSTPSPFALVHSIRCRTTTIIR